MRLVVQRVTEARCTVDGRLTGSIGQGYMVLVGFGHDDDRAVIMKMAEKLVRLRVFSDEQGKMNRSVMDIGGKIRSIPQFTLYGDASKGNRPSFTDALGPAEASEYYDYFNECLTALGAEVEKGVFGAHMEISLVNDGPVTILLDSEVLW